MLFIVILKPTLKEEDLYYKLKQKKTKPRYKRKRFKN